MIRYLLAIGAVVAWTSLIVAAEGPVKKKPAEVKSYNEATKEFRVGEKVEVLSTKYVAQVVSKTIKVGNEVRTVNETVMVPVTVAETILIPARTHSLGLEGWHDNDGFNVEKLAADSPLKKVTTPADNKDEAKTWTVEPGDIITKIDGKPVTNELQIYIALQRAATPSKLPVEVLVAKDGKVQIGFVAATKAKQ